MDLGFRVLGFRVTGAWLRRDLEDGPGLGLVTLGVNLDFFGYTKFWYTYMRVSQN